MARAKAVTNGIVVDVDDSIGVVDYMGFSLRATADAIVNVRQGTVTGLILSTHHLFAASPGETFMFDEEEGLRCEGDLYCEIVSGTIVGSLYYG